MAITLFLMISIATSMTLIPNVNAHTPAWNIQTYAFCSVSPNPIGEGQHVYVNFWLNQPPPTASGQYGDRYGNMTVKVTKPDGTTETLGPFTSDATGGTSTSYTPNQIGNYTFQMFFGGQILAGNNLPAGTPISGPNANVYIGDYFKPCESNIFTLTVQQQPLTYPATASLPTEYWTRPIYGENNPWYTIAGNWLGTANSDFANTGMFSQNGNYNPYTTAPRSSHIIWTKPEAFGGIIGGAYGGSETANFYSTSQYEPKFAPIIMNGILYYNMYPGASSNPAGWAAVDLHTGETIWTKNTTEGLKCGQILNLQLPNQYGALAYLWSTPVSQPIIYLGFSHGTDLKMYDAMTGNYILTITNATSMKLTTDAQGDLIGYYVNSTDNTLNMWNSTRCINLAIPNAYGGPNTADNWMWRPPQDAVIDFAPGIQWTAPLATNISGTPIFDPANGLLGLGIYGISNDGVIIMNGQTTEQFTAFAFQPGWQIEAGYSATDGHQLWIANQTKPAFSTISSIVGNGGTWLGNGVYVECSLSTLSVTGISTTTGKELWGPIKLPNANPFSSLGANNVIANDTIYIWLYGGDVYSIDLATGNINWHYSTPSGGYESPIGANPLWTFTVGTVADGILFVPEGHMYSPPLFHDAQQLALNITNGEVVWSIDAFDTTSAPAISDGVMVTLNAYDNQIYGYGKGPSSTTTEVQQFGTQMVIRGTVTDISAGTQQEAQKANYPHGVPCISEDSMTAFMEALYMQQPKPNNATGVPVTLSVIDSNGNYRTIGTTTSDASGMYTYTWTPDIAGDYTVIASFAGSESYYGSSAETSFTVGQTSTATPQPTQAPSMADLYFLPGVAAIIIVIIVVGVVLLLAIRKRP
jgi:outer membrane protein assembly factor BamB